MLWWTAAKLFFRRNLVWIVILAVSVAWSGSMGWAYIKGREAILKEYAEDRDAQIEKERELATRSKELDRKLAEVAAERKARLDARIEENRKEWEDYVRENPDDGCTVRDDDGLRYIQGIFGKEAGGDVVPEDRADRAKGTN